MISSNITNELTGGIQGGANALGDGLSPADYAHLNGNLLTSPAPAQRRI